MESEADLLFLAVAWGGHRVFALPFAVSALITHPTARVEIVASPGDADQMAAELACLGPKILVRPTPPPMNGWHAPPTPQRGRHPAGTIRWLLHPVTPARHTYICDIDYIICRRDLVQCCGPLADLSKVPYANIVRRQIAGHTRQLTGLHWVESQKYFPAVAEAQLAAIARIDAGDLSLVDEALLCQLCRETVGLPPPQYWGRLDLRPIPGIHLSVMPRSLPPEIFRDYARLAHSELWQKWLPIFAPLIRLRLTRTLELPLRAAQPTSQASRPTPCPT